MELNIVPFDEHQVERIRRSERAVAQFVHNEEPRGVSPSVENRHLVGRLFALVTSHVLLHLLDHVVIVGGQDSFRYDPLLKTCPQRARR